MAMEHGRFGLTDRQLTVLEYAAQGLSNQEIASRLAISCKTVKVHMTQVFVKLDVTCRAGAVAKALRSGLVA